MEPQLVNSTKAQREAMKAPRQYEHLFRGMCIWGSIGLLAVVLRAWIILHIP